MLKHILFISILCFNIAAFSGFDNLDETIVLSRGRVVDDVSSCEIQQYKKPFFYVAGEGESKKKPFVNLRKGKDKNSRITSKLVSGSFLYVKRGEVSNVGKDEMALITVVKKVNASVASRIGEGKEAYINGKDVDVPDKWVYKVIKSRLKGTSRADAEYLSGKNIRIHKIGNSYAGVKCCKGSQCTYSNIFQVLGGPKRNKLENFVAMNPFDIRAIKTMSSVKLKSPAGNSYKRPKLKVASKKSTAPSNEATRTATAKRPKTKIVDGSAEKIICVKKGSRLNVRNDKLRKSFKAKSFEVVTPFQGWNAGLKKRGNYKYVKVIFPELRSKNTGWVATNFIKTKADCGYYKGSDKNSGTRTKTANTSSNTLGLSLGGGSRNTGTQPVGEARKLGSRSKMMICSKSSVNARDSRLKVIFKIPATAKVEVYNNVRVKIGRAGGKKYSFKKIRIVKSGKARDVWVAETLLREGKSCGRSSKSRSKSISVFVELLSPVTPRDNMFVFPITKKPTKSYLRGGTEFAARRKGGRIHAACDLKRPPGDVIRAVYPGKVIRVAGFYSGTNAIVVKQDNGEVIRYGEVSKKAVKGIKPGVRVKKGQVIGYVGRLKSGNSMLHFELYTGKEKGPLTQRGSNKFQRRRDIQNPTERLQVWQKRTL